MRKSNDYHSGMPELNTQLIKAIFLRVPYVLSGIFELFFKQERYQRIGQLATSQIFPKKGVLCMLTIFDQ